MLELRSKIGAMQSSISRFSKCRYFSIYHESAASLKLRQRTNESVSVADTEDWLQDLELMHNYSHRTSRTKLGSNIRLQHVWQEHIPVEAARHSFLMHGVLALSALHLATMKPAQKAKYASLCDKHQASALSSYRYILTHITDDVANALFALSTILSISSLARATLRASEMAEPQHINVESICELLYLTRGVREVKEATNDLISRGPFAVVLFGHQISADVQVTMSPDIMDVFRGLERMVHSICLEQDERKHCSDAVAHLQSVFESILGKYMTGNLEMGHIWRWTAMLSYDFIKMVQAEYPPALVITAHFTVATLMLRETWYVSEWGSLAFEGVRLALKGQLGEYLQWPEEQMASDNAGLKYGGATVETVSQWQDDISPQASGGPTPMIQTPLAE